MTFEKFFGHDIDFSKAAVLFTVHHYIYIISGLLVIFLVLLFAKKIRASGKDYYLKRYWVVLLIVLEVMYHIHNWTYPRFSIPLHICSFATFMSVALLLTDSKRVFKYVFFFGTLGGIMALTIPLSLGYTYYNFRYYHFLILHCSIIAVPLYYYKAYDYRVTYRQLWNVFKGILLLAIVVHLINLTFLSFGFDTNYWYISYIPANVDGFFKSYPIYVLSFMLAVFATMNILYFVTKDEITIELEKYEQIRFKESIK